MKNGRAGSGWAWCMVALMAAGCHASRPCAYALIDGICPVPCESVPGELCYPDGGVVGAEGGVDGGTDGGDGGVDAAGDARGDSGVDAASDGDGAVDGGDADAAPSCTSGPCVRQVAVGGDHACAVRMDGTVWCWGDNSAGQLGDGTTSAHLRPTQVPGLSGVRQVAVGNVTCVVLESGGVECWGDNTAGLVGDGTTVSPRFPPTTVIGVSDAVEVAIGRAHVCVRLARGGIACWGEDGLGELGDGMLNTRYLSAPAAIGSDAVDLAVGGYFSCVVESSGGMQCWGDGNSGQVGDGTLSMSHTTPTDVSGINSALQVTAGFLFACAALSDQTVRCWGDSTSGQLGNGTVDSIGVPVPGEVTALGAVVQLAAGDDHVCARLATGAVDCWGANLSGQLGDGTTMQRDTAVIVPGISGASQIAAGTHSTCAIVTGGILECWGSNTAGQLGTGDTMDRSRPSLVSF